MRPSSSPSSTWPLGLKSNSTAESDRESRLWDQWDLITINTSMDHINHLVSVRPAPPPSPGSRLQLADKGYKEQLEEVCTTLNSKKDAFHRKAPPRCSVQSVRMHPHHIWVWSVGQSERSSIVFLLQLSLFEEQLNESIADLSTPLQCLGVLWKLRNKQQGLVPNLIYHSRVQQCQDRLDQYESIRGVDTYIGQGFLVLLCLRGKDYVTITCTTSYLKIK